MASANTNASTPVPFPMPDAIQTQQESSTSNPTSASPTTPARRSRTSTNASTSSVTSRVRTASIKFMEASPPPGMWAATGNAASKAPTLAEIRRGSFGSSGWNEENQRYKAERRASQSEEGGSRPVFGKGARTGSSGAMGTEPFPAVTEEEMGAAPTPQGAPEKTAFHTPQYDSKEKDMGVDLEPKESSELTEVERNAPRRLRAERQVFHPVYFNCFLDV